MLADEGGEIIGRLTPPARLIQDGRLFSLRGLVDANPLVPYFTIFHGRLGAVMMAAARRGDGRACRPKVSGVRGPAWASELWHSFSTSRFFIESPRPSEVRSRRTSGWAMCWLRPCTL